MPIGADASDLGAQVDAMVLHQPAYPDPGFDPRPVLRLLTEMLFRTPETR